MDEGPGHTLWLGTMDGLEIYDLDRQTFTAVRHDPDDPGSLPAGSIRAIIKDKAGRMWITGWGRGVSCLEPGETKFRHFRHNPEDPRQPEQQRGAGDLCPTARTASGWAPAPG